MKHRLSKLKAFTLLELLLTITLMAMMFSIMLPAFSNFQKQTDIDTAKILITQSIRTAATFSQGATDDSEWGVHLASTGVTVFKGTAYASRDSAFDRVYYFPRSVTVSGINDFYFSKVYGMPSTAGTITIALYNTSVQVSLNEKGQINY